MADGRPVMGREPCRFQWLEHARTTSGESVSPPNALEVRIRWSSGLFGLGNALLAQQSVTPGFRRGARNRASRRETAVQDANRLVLLRFTGQSPADVVTPSGCSR